VVDSLPRSRARTPRRAALTDADLELLRFMAQHRFVLADHAAVLLGVTPVTAQRRLEKLADGGYARRAAVFRGRPPMHLITTTGLRAIGSTLPTPTVDLHNYEHDLGLAWLWLTARRETFGPLSEIFAERTLRSRDGAAERGTLTSESHERELLGVRLGGTGARGRERLHYPDLLLRTSDGRWVALELELSTKGRTRLESILAAYGADPRIAGVVYLVETPAVARVVERAARKVGVPDLIHLQRVRPKVKSPPPARGPALERTQARGR
jgi:hypothetical protein